MVSFSMSHAEKWEGLTFEAVVHVSLYQGTHLSGIEGLLEVHKLIWLHISAQQ